MADGTVLTYLDSYCERAGNPALWGEPLNALTNLFFIVAAILAVRAILKLPAAPVRDRMDLWLLAFALFSIGIGSGLWHLHPTGTTVLMDVIPITVFINVYLIAALRRLFQLPWIKVFAGWGLYQAIGIEAQLNLSPDLLHGTVMYLPTYGAMLVLTVGLLRVAPAYGRQFALITAVWTASLVFRTIDLEICAQWHLGTHFLWHTLNAWVLYRLFGLLVRPVRGI